MARLNVYVPDDLAAEVRASDINVSAVTQAALRAELARRATNRWLSRFAGGTSGVTHEQALRALDEARDELGS